jgi:hypothetical protein
MMSPEDELCLLLARGQLSREAQERALGLLRSALRWDLLLERAREHLVVPLLYRSLRAFDFQGVPDAPRAQLTTAFRMNALRNAYLAGELARVLQLLNDSGVRVIPLKGVALAESLYGDSAFRVCSDIDILVAPSEALLAHRLLVAHGYTSPFTEDFFANHQFRAGAECPLTPEKPLFSYQLEFHWTLLHHSRKDVQAIQDLWFEARPRGFFGVQAYGMTPEWQFLYLACHAAHHKWHTLQWLADIHELCVSAQIDWQQVQEKSERFELDSVVGATLAACSSLFGTPAPANFPSRALPAGVHLFPTSLAPSEVWSEPLFHPGLLKRPSEKFRWFAEMIFVPRLADNLFIPLPPALSFLYYFLRPLRLAGKWSGLLLSAGFRSLRRRLHYALPRSRGSPQSRSADPGRQ